MKLGLFLPNWIGDACMAIPTLRALKHGLSRKIEFIGIARPGPAALLSSQGWLDRFLIYQSRSGGPILNRRQLVGQMRQERLDAVVLFPNSLSSAAMVALARVPRRIGYARDGRSWLLTDAVRPRMSWGRPLPTPMIDYYLQLADHMGCPSVDRQMELTVDPSSETQRKVLWQKLGFELERPTVVINNNAATSPARLWPADSIVKLAEKLVRTTDAQVLFHCGPRERLTANEWADRVNHPRVKSMGIEDDLPLGLSLAVLASAATVVTTDSGVRSLAVALNRSIVSLFGPTKPEWTTTYNRPEQIVRPEVACRACENNPRHRNDTGDACRCMQRISVDRVYQAIRHCVENADCPSRKMAA